MDRARATVNKKKRLQQDDEYKAQYRARARQRVMNDINYGGSQ